MSEEQTPEEFLDEMIFVVRLHQGEANHENLTAQIELYRGHASYTSFVEEENQFFDQVQQLVDQQYAAVETTQN